MGERMLLALGSSLALLAHLILDEGSLVRAVLVGLFVLLAPGFAVAGHLRLGPLWTSVLAVALSLVLAQGVALSLMYAGLWNPTAALLLLVMITTVAAWGRTGREAWRARRSHAPSA